MTYGLACALAVLWMIHHRRGSWRAMSFVLLVPGAVPMATNGFHLAAILLAVTSAAAAAILWFGVRWKEGVGRTDDS